jgi:hypothetical protein
MADVGPWARVVDTKGAQQAVRMAGLPVFLIGLMTMLFAGIALLTVMASGLTIIRPLPFALPLLAGLALVALGLALRAGRAGLVPLAALPTLANAALSAVLLPLWALPVQVMVALVALSGLRGWWWLRKNPA